MARPFFGSGKTIFKAENPVLEGPFFNSEYPVLKTKLQQAGVVSGTGGVVTVSHKLGYVPQFMFFIERIPDGRMNLVNNNYDPLGTWQSRDSGDSLDATCGADQDDIILFWLADSGTYHHYVYVYYDPATELT